MKILKKLMIMIFLFYIVIQSLDGLGTSTTIDLITNYKQIFSSAVSKYLVKVTRKTGNIDYIDLETYLIGVVAGEMPATFEIEALKAQAVASRTFALSRNLKVDDSTQTQVYLDDDAMKKNWGADYEEKRKKIKEAVDATKGEVLTYNGNLISSVFFSCSNGSTEDNNNYFNVVEIPYLRAVSSPWDETVNLNFSVDKSFTESELKDKLSVNKLDIKVISYYDSGRINVIEIGGKEFTGREVRELLGLRSTDFTISKVDSKYIITTKGSGHGVGMSQYGAQGMALSNYSYKEILLYYYNGVKLEKK